jgi:hypothetical protein
LAAATAASRPVKGRARSIKALLETAPRNCGLTKISRRAFGHRALRLRKTGAVRMMSPSEDILMTSMRGSGLFIPMN